MRTDFLNKPLKTSFTAAVNPAGINDLPIRQGKRIVHHKVYAYGPIIGKSWIFLCLKA
jgi:hypothetical protein